MTPPASVTGSLRRLGASLVALGRIRLELLTIEIQEEKERLALVLFWAVLTALLCGFGLLFLALCITVAWWDTQRLAALAVCCAAFVVLALIGAMRLRGLLSKGAAPLSASLGELRDDENGLRQHRTPT